VLKRNDNHYRVPHTAKYMLLAYADIFHFVIFSCMTLHTTVLLYLGMFS